MITFIWSKHRNSTWLCFENKITVHDLEHSNAFEPVILFEQTHWLCQHWTHFVFHAKLTFDMKCTFKPKLMFTLFRAVYSRHTIPDAWSESRVTIQLPLSTLAHCFYAFLDLNLASKHLWKSCLFQFWAIIRQKVSRLDKSVMNTIPGPSNFNIPQIAALVFW